MKKYRFLYWLFGGLFLASIAVTPTNAQQKTKTNLFTQLRQKQIVPQNSNLEQNSPIKTIPPQAIYQRIIRQSIRLQREFESGKTTKSPNNLSNLQNLSLATGSISGCVFEQDGITPIQEWVRIEAFDDVGVYMGSDYVTSYDNCYEIEDLPAGDYYVYAFSDYYINEFYDNATEFSQATLIHVNEGQAVTSINFSLEQAAAGNSAISGHVTDPNGLPVSECDILVWELNYDLVKYVYPNSSGYYLVTGLEPEGQYKLQLEYYGNQNLAGEWYENASNFWEANIVTTSFNDTTENIDFALNWGGTITGKVLQPDGSPLGQFDYIWLVAFNLYQDYVGETNIDEIGNFSVTGLQTGSYKLYYEYNGGNNYIGGYYQNANSFETATPIPVTAGDTTSNIICYLNRAGAISGKVTGPDGLPIEWEVEVEGYDEAGESVAWAQTETGGTYMITGLAPGRYKVFANYMSHYASVISQTPASEWYNGYYSMEEADWVTVNAGAVTDNINFTLEAGGEVEGKVYSPENTLLDYSGTVIAFDLLGNQVREGIHANLGTYVVAGLPTGSYKLYFQYEGEQNYMGEFYDGKNNFWSADIVDVVAGHWTHGIDFTLDYISGIKGMIQDWSGNALLEDDHYIIVYLMDALSGDFIDANVTTQIGGYKFLLHAGEVKIAAASGYGNWMNQHDSLRLTFYGQGGSLDDPNTQAISVIPDSIISLDPIKMDKATGAISGRVFAPLTDELVNEGLYYIFAFDEHGCLAKFSAYEEQYGGIDGSYSLRGLRPGNYYLLAHAAKEQHGRLIWQSTMWYGGILGGDIDGFFPKTTIPQGAVPVAVGGGETANIDFHLLMPSGVKSNKFSPTVNGYRLDQNYPNPFNIETVIGYHLPKTGHVELSIYNLLGQKIASLVNGEMIHGSYEVKWAAKNLPSGVYFIHMEAGDFKQTRKCLLLK